MMHKGSDADKEHQLDRLFGISRHAEYQIMHACRLLHATLVIRDSSCTAVLRDNSRHADVT